MKLNELLKHLPVKSVQGNTENIEIAGICYDPLRVERNFLYAAINIYTQLDGIELPDGHPFVHDAIARGATCVVVERPVECPANIVQIVVPNSRVALSKLADEFYGSPAKKMRLLGVTGTNGKTTTTHILERIFAIEHRFGLIGSLYYKIDGVIHNSKDTTPEPPDLQAIFARMVAANCDFCALEASSHGIDFHRLDNLAFAVGMFTNLTPDHLDYHKTMENYREAKVTFFRNLPASAHAVVNIDDPAAGRFIEATRATILRTSLQQSADVTADNIRYDIHSTQFNLHTPLGTVPITSPLIGNFNVYNLLTAVAAAISQGISLDIIRQGLETPLQVAGRFQKVECGQKFGVIIDYAHTSDSMENVLKTAKALRPKRLITVFGCGGNRDRTKRPRMGEIACRFSDFAILTSDNPRYEDPLAIIRDIEAGMTAGNYSVEPDRKTAIHKAITLASQGDLIMILGKGHETYQEIKGVKYPFDDKAEVAKAMEELL